MALKAPMNGLSFSLHPSSSTVAPRMITFPLRTSTFNGGVGALKVRTLKTSRSNSFKCGALGTRMNLFDRLARVIKSYANALLSSMEDPEKILEQSVIDMADDLTKMTAQVLASQKRLENKYKATQQASDEWYRRAELALSKGDEDLAREALKRRKSYADTASSLKAQLDQQRVVVEDLLNKTRVLENKIQEARLSRRKIPSKLVLNQLRLLQKLMKCLGMLTQAVLFLHLRKWRKKCWLWSQKQRPSTN